MTVLVSVMLLVVCVQLALLAPPAPSLVHLAPMVQIATRCVAARMEAPVTLCQVTAHVHLEYQVSSVKTDVLQGSMVQNVIAVVP